MMGIGEDRVKKLQSEVNIVFHSAATVRFDEHIRNAYETNVNGTKYLLEIAKGMKDLKVNSTKVLINPTTDPCLCRISSVP